MLRVVVFGVLALGISGCQGGRSVVPISLDASRLEVPADPRLLTTHESAVRGIGAMLAREFGLPLPAEVTLYVYGSRRVFEEGLVSDARLSPARAAELSASALGVGRPRQLLFHDVSAQRDREWLRLVAHELTHVCQIELAGGDRGPAQWLKEGMAEWVAFGVLERLGLDSVARRREIALAGVRRSVVLAAPSVRLEAMDSAAGFSERYRRGGPIETYQLSFLMVDYLVGRGGFPRLVEYFKAFAESRDHERNFERSFGLAPRDFERAALADLVTHS
jgi:hypothetical protein